MRAANVITRISSSVSVRVSRVLITAFVLMAASLSLSAQITVSPASIKFKTKQVVGTTSSSQPVTISNGGASAQPIVIVMSGDFTETDNCAGSVAAGGSCKANISFAPTQLGAV